MRRHRSRSREEKVDREREGRRGLGGFRGIKATRRGEDVMEERHEEERDVAQVDSWVCDEQLKLRISD